MYGTPSFQNGKCLKVWCFDSTPTFFSAESFSSTLHVVPEEKGEGKVDFFKKGGKKNEFLHKIGQSFITNLKVTYGEGEVQSFFKETGAPTHVKLDISFKENFALSRQSVEEGF